MSTIDPAIPFDLSDAQWALLEPLTPPARRLGRPRRWPIRSLVDGVRHRARVGCPWRDVPLRYSPWWRIYGLFACWQVLGVWDRIESALRSRAATAKRVSWQVSVDSTTARAHIHAAGARQDSVDRVAGEPDHHALGRSRGGWGTKTHVAIDQDRGVLSFRTCELTDLGEHYVQHGAYLPELADTAQETATGSGLTAKKPKEKVPKVSVPPSLTAKSPACGSRGPHPDVRSLMDRPLAQGADRTPDTADSSRRTCSCGRRPTQASRSKATSSRRSARTTHLIAGGDS